MLILVCLQNKDDVTLCVLENVANEINENNNNKKNKKKITTNEKRKKNYKQYN